MIYFFRSEDGGISWFLVKINENKGKTLVFLCFSLVWGDSSENHEMPPSSGRKKINHPSSKKKSFLSNTWNTLKTSFLKCLRVCNFFFSQRCWCSQHLKKYHFWILCENRLLNFRSQLRFAKTRGADLFFSIFRFYVSYIEKIYVSYIEKSM